MKKIISKQILICLALIVFSVLMIGCTGIVPSPTGNHAPVITSTPLYTTAKINQIYTYGVKASDADGDTLTYSLMVKPVGMYINSETGLITWIPAFNQTGVHNVTVKVSDGKDSDTQIFTITIAKTSKPTIEITSVPVTSVTVDELYTYDVEATDPQGDPLTYALTVSPAGMVIDAATGVITWTPDATLIGNHDVTVEVTDGEDVETQTFIVTVYDILTAIVVLPETMNLYAYQSQAITSVIASFQNTPDRSVGLAACSYNSDTPAVATVAAGVITGVAAGSATITVSYTEGAITMSDTVDVTVIPAELTSITVLPANMALVIGQNRAITSVTASYNFGPNKSIALAACSYNSGTPAVATVAAGVISGVAIGSATITVEYTEGAITKSDTVSVTVSDVPIELPTLELTPANQNVSSGNPATINVVIEDVTDLKGASVTLNFDASKLQYTSSADGGFIPGAFHPTPPATLDNVAGVVVLDIAGLGLTADGTGTIFTVTFNTTAAGSADITFGTTELRDSANVDIAHDTGSGCSVTIN